MVGDRKWQHGMAVLFKPFTKATIRYFDQPDAVRRGSGWMSVVASMRTGPMNMRELIATARALVACDKGLLAMDESNPTCNKRFAKLGIPRPWSPGAPIGS